MPAKTKATDAEFDHILDLYRAYEWLKMHGWREPRYFQFPRDGQEFEGIELGSTGIHRMTRRNGYTWADVEWPAEPCLVREVKS